MVFRIQAPSEIYLGRGLLTVIIYSRFWILISDTKKKYQKLIRETNIGSSSGVGVGFVIWYGTGFAVGVVGGTVGGVPGAGWKLII